MHSQAAGVTCGSHGSFITHKYHKKDEASPLMKCIRRYV